MDFISILSIFVLACFVGYYVVWSVTPALHTPLMAVTNAISSVIIVGALIAAAGGGRARRRNGSGWPRWCWRASTSSAASRSPRACSPCTRRRSARLMHGADPIREARACMRPPPYRPGCCSPIWSRGSASSLRCAACRARPARRRGNRFGMFGMAIAVVTTTLASDAASVRRACWPRSAIAIAHRRRASASSPRGASR